MDDEIYIDEEMEPNPDLNRITNAVIGAAIDVHKALGPGYVESVYQQALAIAFTKRSIRFKAQHPFSVAYEGVEVGEGRLDFLIEDTVVVELKAMESFHPVHTAQVISYMKATHCHLALLINFNVRKLTDGIKRIAL